MSVPAPARKSRRLRFVVHRRSQDHPTWRAGGVSPLSRPPNGGLTPSACPGRFSLLAVCLTFGIAAVFSFPSQIRAQDDASDGNASETTAAATTAAPIRRIVLFNSGVGYFERRGTVSGDAAIDLKFNVDDINDLLKSMIVQDADGGSVSTVTYGSRDPVARTLATFAIDLTAEPSLGELLRQIRGERITLEAPMPIEGAIVGVETQRRQLGDDQTVEVQLLTLLTDEGLRRVPLDQAGRIQLARPELDAELRQALATLALGHATDKKTVSLHFAGEGERRVRIGYVLEAPVWKTSYRLVLGEGDKPFLQGWAIVENTTDADWENVQLSLVSGRPISFTMDLYSPLFASRPEVTPELYATLAPQIYGQDLGVADESERVAGVARERQAAGRAMGDFGGGGFGGAVPEASAPSADADFDSLLSSSIATAASAADVGELFQYEIAVPVTLPRQSSAMLPIINAEVAGSKVSIYNPAVHATHPLNGVRLKNTSGLHLMQGPVTVLDDGVYAGDARIPDLPAGSERLLSYAMDLDLEVAPRSEARPQSLLTARIANGALLLAYQEQRVQTYVIKNSGDREKSLLIEHPHDPSQGDWQLVAPEKPTEQTRDVYRFAVEAPADETTSLEIKERRTVHQRFALLNSNRIGVYVDAQEIPDAVKAALREVMERQAVLAELSERANQIEREIDAIAREQDRIRNNMRAIDRNTDLYNRYVKKLNEQEDEVERLREEAETVRAQIESKQKGLNDYVADLDIGDE